MEISIEVPAFTGSNFRHSLARVHNQLPMRQVTYIVLLRDSPSIISLAPIACSTSWLAITASVLPHSAANLVDGGAFVYVCVGSRVFVSVVQARVYAPGVPVCAGTWRARSLSARGQRLSILPHLRSSVSAPSFGEGPVACSRCLTVRLGSPRGLATLWAGKNPEVAAAWRAVNESTLAMPACQMDCKTFQKTSHCPVSAGVRLRQASTTGT